MSESESSVVDMNLRLVRGLTDLDTRYRRDIADGTKRTCTD